MGKRDAVSRMGHSEIFLFPGSFLGDLGKGFNEGKSGKPGRFFTQIRCLASMLIDQDRRDE